MTVPGFYGESIAESDLMELGPEIGQGNESTIHSLPNFPGMVYKKYRAGSAPDLEDLQPVLDVAVRLRESDETDLLRHAAWPVNVVLREPVVAGVILPEVPDRYYVSNGVKRRHCKWDFAYDPQETGLVLADSARLRLCERIVSVFRSLDEAGLTFTDVSGSNGLWDPRDAASVILLDVDAARCGWTEDKRAENWRTPEDDLFVGPEVMRYRVALLVCRILSASLGFGTDATIRRVQELGGVAVDDALGNLLRPAHERENSLGALQVALARAYEESRLLSSTPPTTPKDPTKRQPSTSEPWQAAFIDRYERAVELDDVGANASDQAQPARPAAFISARYVVVSLLVLVMAATGLRLWSSDRSDSGSNSPALTTPQGPHYRVRTPGANLRSGPGTDHAVLDALPQGTEVASTGATSISGGPDAVRWIQIAHNGQLAWISERVVEPVGP